MPTPPGDAAVLPASLGLLRPVLTLVFVLAFLVLLISTNVRWLTEDRGLYLAGFEKYRVGQTTGLTAEQLERVADVFIAYFRGPRARLDLEVVRDGRAVPLFNEREIVHMQDVQRLVHGFHTAQLASGLLLGLIAAIGLALWRQAFVSDLGRMGMLAAGTTILLLALVGALAALDFQSVFVRFHLLSFQNDYWILDPSRDYLIMLFPYGFWLDATLRLALATGLEALGAGVAGFALLRLAPPPA